MTGVLRPPISPRKGLFALASGFMAIALLWAIGSVADLYDGKTYNERGRYSSGPKWYPVTAKENPSTFKAIVVLRAGLPVILLGTIGCVCLVGALAQPRSPRS